MSPFPVPFHHRELVAVCVCLAVRDLQVHNCRSERFENHSSAEAVQKVGFLSGLVVLQDGEKSKKSLDSLTLVK